MRYYLLGVATLPGLYLAARTFFISLGAVLGLLERRFGVSFEVKFRRHPEGINDYTLRRDVWWERSFGPVFVGCWYREDWRCSSDEIATRWIGFGRTSGASFIVYRLRNLTQERKRRAGLFLEAP